MKVSELINQLKEIQKEHGDLRVTQYRTGRIMEKPEPAEVKNLRILGKRESVQDYWEDWRSNCSPENKGEKVIAL